jgi:hypothetical protein
VAVAARKAAGFVSLLRRLRCNLLGGGAQKAAPARGFAHQYGQSGAFFAALQHVATL